MYTYIKQKLAENKNVTVSSLFDEFQVDDNSLIDKVINYSFPEEKVFNVYLTDTINRVKQYALKQEYEKIKQKMLTATTEGEQLEFLAKLNELSKKIN